eukprot:13531160-Alexandrium_andersonii.AAC.1
MLTAPHRPPRRPHVPVKAMRPRDFAGPLEAYAEVATSRPARPAKSEGPSHRNAPRKTHMCGSVLFRRYRLSSRRRGGRLARDARRRQ